MFSYFVESVHPAREFKNISGCFRNSAIVTRIRLKIRASVDIEQTNILSIMQYWILLPVCPVSYLETGQEEVKVGFSNVKEALQYLTSQAKGDLKDADSTEDILTDSYNENSSERYELAYKVYNSSSFERSFVRSNGAESAVCVEGIRVDSTLPYFNPDFCALLSVRGNRKFRTTVSRATLERDDEYEKAGKICANLLFNHITSEMKRITEQPGEPLSQASTAGRWSSRRLIQSSTGSIPAYIKACYARIPSVVMERLREQKPTNEFYRELVSLDEIASLSELWTIESRTIDLLGTISRDIGKELTVGEFLGALAPELHTPTVSPVIPDAWGFIDDILQSHTVTSAEFSRKHQRTILKWEPTQFPLMQMKQVATQKFFEKIVEIFDLRNPNRAGIDLPSPNVILEDINRVIVAPTQGDVKNIIGVKTRLVTVLDKDSDIGASYQELIRVLKELYSEPEDYQNFALFASLCWIFGSAFIPIRTESYRYSRNDTNTVKEIWREHHETMNTILSKHNSSLTLSPKADELIGNHKHWFDASSYWRNWFNELQ